MVKKNQTTICDEVQQKILALYGLGMSYKDISSHIKKMYGIGVVTGMFSAGSIATVKPWQGRPLETVYTILGVTLEG